MILFTWHSWNDKGRQICGITELGERDTGRLPQKIWFLDSPHKNFPATLSTALSPHGGMEVGATVRGRQERPCGREVFGILTVSVAAPRLGQCCSFLRCHHCHWGKLGTGHTGSISLSFLKTAWKPIIIYKQSLIRKKREKKKVTHASCNK